MQTCTLDPHLKKKTLVPPTLNVVRLYSTSSVLFRIKKAIPQTAERKVTKKIDFLKGNKQYRIPSKMTGTEIKGMVIMRRK